jgi:hypothetical protein
MSVLNEPKYKNGLLQAIREQLEHRALWMYLLCDEAAKKGLTPEEYAPEAIKRCGLQHEGNCRRDRPYLPPRTESLIPIYRKVL